MSLDLALLTSLSNILDVDEKRKEMGFKWSILTCTVGPRKAPQRTFPKVVKGSDRCNRSQDGAFLEFNIFDSEIQEFGIEKVSAPDIAKVLLEYNVDCAVLNSCKSGFTDAGVRASLSGSFLENGLARVLAMSYNIPDSMSEIFYHHFYHDVLVSGQGFTHAASSARHKLRTNPKRWSYTHGKFVPIRDWFVPVVYSDEHSWSFQNNQDLESCEAVSMPSLSLSVTIIAAGVLAAAIYIERVGISWLFQILSTFLCQQSNGIAFYVKLFCFTASSCAPSFWRI